MQKIIEGAAFVLSDNVDTDQIIPAEHLVYSLENPEESKLYGKYALSGVPLQKSGLPQGNVPFVADGRNQSEFSIIIGGGNFGCGSSREHAPFALNKAGVKAIIAESYARIFYRNAVDGGFIVPLETSENLYQSIKTGDRISINLKDYVLKNLEDGQSYPLISPGDALPIIDAGGLFKYARTSGII